MAGARSAAASFGNANQGIIAAGSSTNSITLSQVFPYVGFVGFVGFDLPELDISATNLVNTGLLDVGMAGVMNVGGNHVDLSKSTLHVEGFDDVLVNPIFAGGVNLSNLIGTNIILGAFNANAVGIFNVFEGIGLQTNQLSIFGNFSLPNATSPLNNVTNAFSGLIGFDIVAPPNATPGRFPDGSQVFT